MENKYYIPEISEFHVGFEFEMKKAEQDEWVKMIYSYLSDYCFDVHWFQDEKKEVHVPDCIRVKYLDNYDVTELGFKDWRDVRGYWTASADTEIFPLINEDYYLNIHMTQNIRNGRIILESVFRKTAESYIIFDGIIKNKSELKKLLKQLQLII
jgi:hypothetical protein